VVAGMVASTGMIVMAIGAIGLVSWSARDVRRPRRQERDGCATSGVIPKSHSRRREDQPSDRCACGRQYLDSRAMPRFNASRDAEPAPHMLAKVPEITVIFWLLKLISTGMGEAMSDYAGSVSKTYGAVAGIVLVVVALWLQLRQREYRAPYYWFAVGAIAVFGTMAADGVHGDLGVGYAITAPGFALITGAIFLWWYRSEGTLSIHRIDTPRRERFYWAAVFGTFALGTAAGDLTATTFNLGYLDSILLFAGVIAIPAIGWWRFNMNPIVGFWFAYIVTRPLGASFADWFSKPPAITGLALGNGLVSWMSLAVFVPIVAWVAITKLDVLPGHNARARPEPAHRESEHALAPGPRMLASESE
jgi:uncharacterized membrane-anchored protein